MSRLGSILRLVLCAGTFLALPALSQTNISRPAPRRYLFIVETSRSMGHRSDGTIKTVANLLFSGMYGQIRQGDTIGVWSYNKELYTGRLPLQRWSTLEQRDVCSAILNFIKSQKYDSQPAFSSVRPPLENVIKDSEFITVVLVSSGEEKMLGTPFDDQMNQLYDNWREEQQKSRMPFVTVLRAKRGTIIGYSVTPTPWQIEIPAWPVEPVVKAVEQPRPPPKTQPSTIPPLIFSGKKSKPAEPTNSTDIVTPELGNSNVAASNPSPTLISRAPAESATPQKLSTNPPAETALLERKIERPADPPPHPLEPRPTLIKEPLVTVTPPSAADTSSASNTLPAAAQQKSAAPSEEISTAITAPQNGFLSNKVIWLVALGVLAL